MMIKKLLIFLALLSSFSLLNAAPPVIPLEEKESYNKILKLVKENPQAALSELAKLPADCSAVFDLIQGNILLSQKKLAEAETALKKALQKHAGFYQAELNLSSLYLQKNSPAQALPHLLGLVRLGRADGDIWKKVAFCHMQAKNYLAAGQALENARAFLPADEQIEQNFLKISLLQQDYEQALKISNQLLDKNPKDKQVWQISINCLSQLGRNKECLRHFELFVRLFEVDAQQNMNLAALYFNEGLYDDAEKRYALVTGEQSLSALLNRIHCLQALARPKQILELLQEIPKKLTPAQAENIYLLRGNAQAALQQTELALKDFKKSLSFNSLNARTQYRIAELYDTEKQFSEALNFYEQAARDKRFASSSHMRRSRIFLKQKLYQQALAAANNALQHDDSAAVRSFRDQVKILVDRQK